MPATSSVRAPGDGATDSPRESVYGWDWSATTHEGTRGTVHHLLETLGAHNVLPGKGLQGWNQSFHAYDREGFKSGAVYFGGGREDIHVVSSSRQADGVRQAVAGIGAPKTARVDTRVDTLLPFSELRGLCEAVAGPQTKVTYMESTIGGQNVGRTLYVGAPSSAVRVRVYEKWLESPGQYVEGTNRVEVQLRPPSRVKSAVTGWSRAETFCASKLTRRLAVQLGTELAEPGTLQKSKGTPDLERTLEAMGEQYGNAVRQWLDLSDGDLGRVLAYLDV